jgi:hypothetical protein
MTTSPEIVLPPLPKPRAHAFSMEYSGPIFSEDHMNERYIAGYEAGRASVSTEANRGVQAVPGEPVARVYGQQYTDEQRAWCQKLRARDDVRAADVRLRGGERYRSCRPRRNSRQWFEDWSNDAYLRGCDDIPGEQEALYEEITGEKL